MTTEFRLLHALVKGYLYRGVFIYQLPTGTALVYSETKQIYDFQTTTEAEAFVDATYALNGSLIGVLA